MWKGINMKFLTSLAISPKQGRRREERRAERMFKIPHPLLSLSESPAFRFFYIRQRYPSLLLPNLPLSTQHNTRHIPLSPILENPTCELLQDCSDCEIRWICSAVVALSSSGNDIRNPQESSRSNSKIQISCNKYIIYSTAFSLSA